MPLPQASERTGIAKDQLVAEKFDARGECETPTGHAWEIIDGG